MSEVYRGLLMATMPAKETRAHGGFWNRDGPKARGLGLYVLCQPVAGRGLSKGQHRNSLQRHCSLWLNLIPGEAFS